MKIGDMVESAIWLTGEESQEMRTRYEIDVSRSIDILCDEKGFSHGPVMFIEKRPEEDRVPEVPDHISGQRVRLLVAEAVLTEKSLAQVSGSFIYNLDRIDLQRLREITRRVHLQYNPDQRLNDMECDKIIEEIGPDAAIDTLRKMH